MFDRKQFREEIEAQLKDLPRDKRVAFAVRSAMRVLPLLGIPDKRKTKKLLTVFTGQNREAFWFWKAEDRSKHLLAILRAYSCSIEFALTKRYARTYAAVDAADAADAADAVIAVAVADAAAYATYANTDDNNAAAYAATYAAYAYTYAADIDVIVQAIHLDLATLAKITAQELLIQPLWSKIEFEKWQWLLNDFKTNVKSLNSGFEVWLSWYDARINGKSIDIELLEKWNSISDELKAQGADKVNAYLAYLVKEKIKLPLNRVRAIFIGYGEAGKTSLIRALHGEKVIKGTEAMTCGIEIRDWQVPNTDIQAHFWDFGGQVVFHSTHKFFLRSSCVYIIVINARADINNSEQAEYWLDHVKVFGGSAPVLLVGNKADEASVHLQMETLKLKYPNLKGFYPVSCTEAKTKHLHDFEKFKQALTEELQAVGIHQMLFTPAQGKVLDELRQIDDAFLNENEFNHICDKHGISNEGELNRDWLVDIFDKLGVMLHFEELKTFHNAYMLNPRWLTHGVYTLMNAKQARLNDSDMVRILANAKVQDEYQHLLSYPADKCLFISKAMQRFKLCYPLRNGDNAMLIPALLCDELNLSGLNDTLQFEFAFSGFLPRNLIGEFMVSRYEEIKDNLQSQRGAVFKSRNLQAEALVEADYHRRLITMQVIGRDAKEYLTILYDAMLTVFGDLALEYTEMVYLPKSACLNLEFFGLNQKTEKADYQQLLACAKEGQSIYITGSRLRYDLAKVLGFIMSKAEQAKQGITNNFNGNIGEIKVSDDKRVINNPKNYFEGNISGGNFAGENVIINNLGENGGDIKVLLEQLLSEIKALNGKIPEAQLNEITDGVETLIKEANRPTPRKEWYQLSLKGLKEAALAVGEIAKPVLAIAEKLSPLLLG
jgi:GTPase SAR1 family protein